MNIRSPYFLPLLPALLVLAGCSLFDTRTPENPLTSGSTFEAPTAPSVVLRNFESALGSANASDYRKCFSDSSRGLPTFRFTPSAQGIAADPTKFNDWSGEEEQEYFQNLTSDLEPGGVCSVIFSPSEVTEVPISDSVQFNAHYDVHFPHTRESSERDAQGLLHFTMRRSRQNEWYITSWRDIAIDSSTSWSLIKARFIDK